MVKTVFAAIGTFALICSAFALTLSSDDQAARDAALQWLKVVDSANYDDAAQMMAEEVRAQQNWPAYIAAHRRP